MRGSSEPRVYGRWWVLGCVVPLCILAGCGSTPTTNTPRTRLTPKDIVQQASGAIVRIEVSDKSEGEKVGTGFIVGADGYIVVASAGDRLRAAISGFPAGSLWLRVSRRGSDKFVDGGKGDSVWEGRLTEAGEYLVEVVRRAPYCEPPVISHLLSLSLTAQPRR